MWTYGLNIIGSTDEAKQHERDQAAAVSNYASKVQIGRST